MLFYCHSIEFYEFNAKIQKFMNSTVERKLEKKQADQVVKMQKSI